MCENRLVETRCKVCGRQAHFTEKIEWVCDPCFEEYKNCYFAYMDYESDDYITSGDIIWLYKDPDCDGNDDIEDDYSFQILDNEGRLIYKTDLK